MKRRGFLARLGGMVAAAVGAKQLEAVAPADAPIGDGVEVAPMPVVTSGYSQVQVLGRDGQWYTEAPIPTWLTTTAGSSVVIEGNTWTTGVRSMWTTTVSPKGL